MQELIFIDAQSVGKNSVGHSVFLENILLNINGGLVDKIVIGLENGVKVKTNLLNKFRIYNYKSNLQIIRRFIEIPYVCFKLKCTTVVTGFVSPFVSSIKRIIIIHDIGYLKYPNYYDQFFLIKIKLLTKFSILFGASVVTVSKYSKSTISNYYKIAPEKIKVVYNGVDSNKYFPINSHHDNSILDKYSIKNNFILFVGTLQPRKNINGIIEAFSEARQNIDKEISLIMIGKNGWGVEKELKKINSNANILHLNKISDDELPIFYRNAECFIYPSYYEGFGIPIIEAMASGIPVITSNNSSLPEIAGDAAILIDPQNIKAISKAIVKLINNIELQRSLIKRGLNQSKLFNWDYSAEEFKKVLI